MIKLALGTVQFGLEYGINNKTGKPEKENSLEMLKTAYKRGIRYFDTAYAYGNAEELLGKFIERNKLQKKVKIVSKLKPNILDGFKGNITNLVEKEITGSIKRLKIDSLEGYLLHTPEYIYNDKLVDALKKNKEKGLIRNFGVSIYDEKEALYAAKLPVDFIQIPYSVFDQRLNKTDFFRIARKNKVTIFARSAFVQGLVFMKDKGILKYLAEARTYLKEFDKIIKNYNLSRLEAALLFSYRNKNIDYVVFGVDNINQLNRDIDIVEKVKEYKKYRRCFDELTNRFVDIKKSIIMPSLWKKTK